MKKDLIEALRDERESYAVIGLVSEDLLKKNRTKNRIRQAFIIFYFIFIVLAICFGWFSKLYEILNDLTEYFIKLLGF